jgi:glycosyltransferase involved in cell wall biosynthesis
MPVYNGDKYLREAIDSILNQTFEDFEFIIINDASTDETLSILNSYADSRMKIHINKRNLGVAKSLNIGLRMAKGKYIARQDADDISMPNRLATQVDFLDRHPDYAAVGTLAKIINENSEEMLLFKRPTKDIDIRKFLEKDNCMIHGSVMIRISSLIEVGFYDEEMERSQDYELWLRLAKRYHMKNISDFLYCRRKQNRNSSINYILEQQTFVALAKIKNDVSDIKETEERFLNTITKNVFIPTKIKNILEWVDKLTFKKIRIYRILQMIYRIRFSRNIKKILCNFKSERIDIKEAKSNIEKTLDANLLNWTANFFIRKNK